MRTTRALGLGAVLAATALIAPGGATAASPTTYTGRFEGTIQYVNCTPGQPTDREAGGTWSVRIYGDTAKAKFLITVNGEKHVFYPFPGMTVDAWDSSGFTVSGDTPAGLLTVKLDGRTLEYTVGTGEADSYHYPGLTCDSVTYPGTAD